MSRKNRMNLFLGSVLAGLLMIFSVNGWAQEDSADGRIYGTLLNGTSAEPASDLEVILRTYEGKQKKPEQTTRTDSEGKFSFTSLERRKEGYTYSLKISYAEIDYYSSVFIFKEEQQEIPVEMFVYEKTDSNEHISVKRHHAVIDEEEGILWAQEVLIVENAGNRVYVGSEEIAPGKKETLRISVPSQAQDMRLLGGLGSSYLVETEDGFVDTLDIKPGRKEVIFGYRIGPTASTITLVKKVYATTGSLDFLIANLKGIQAEGENLEYLGLIGEPGKQYLHFSGKQLSSGMQVTLRLNNNPPQQTTSATEIVPVLGIILLCLGVISPLILRRKKSDGHKMGTDEEATTTPTLQKERQHILLTIADLDEQLDVGQISAEEHDEKRHLLKEKVVELTKILQETTD